MTTWSYIGCKTNLLPKSILKNPNKLTNNDIKSIIDSVPIVEGEIEAYDINAVISLLLYDNIFPLKIHILKNHEKSIKNLIKKIKKK